jgi:chondroitin AC lyase
MHQSIPKSILRRLFIINLVLVITSSFVLSQINIISQRLRVDLIRETVNDNDITNYLTTFNSDGSWNDINYSDSSSRDWPAVDHSRRLKSICTVYNKSTSVYYHSSELKSKITAAIEFYIKTKPQCPNWWFNAIGAPNNLGPALILMKTGDRFGYDQTKLNFYADELLNYYSESALKWPFATTGANKIWLLTSSIFKACIKTNEPVLRSNFQSAFDQAIIMPGINEGIKNDYSYYQHGTQLYCGGYGMAFMDDITNFGTLADSTSYQMSNSQVQIITNAILEGFKWFCQKSAFDFGTTGREISRAGAISSSSLKIIVNRLKLMNPFRSAELNDCYNFINGSSDFTNPGNKHFWKSDIMVQHGPTFYLSARVPSKRTIGTETMNNENLKRKWLPWGATNIMIDGDEYRNIFAVWDWSRIPGVTSVKEEVPGLPVNGGYYLVSSTEFAGGVSDGIFGLAAYDYSWDGVSGRKSYFFTPDVLYCLGAGISASKSNPVITNINQCFSSGAVTLKNKDTISTFDGAEITSSNIKWVHHNRVGYYFPSDGEITVKNMNQTGSWNDINLSESKTPLTYKVFSAWIGHGNVPFNNKYEYVVVPSKSVEQFRTWVESNPLRMISNTTDIQAFHEIYKKVYGIVFYKSGGINLEHGLFVWAEKPCLLLVQDINNGSRYKISISDPTTKLQNINLRISKKLSGPGAVYNNDKTSGISVILPDGDNAGKTITLEYSSD